MKTTVAAVVVTYNRKQLLTECLDGLLSQTQPVDKIILIDNASTDGTPEMLAERGYLSNPILDYKRLSDNTGGSGGFHEGIKRGYESGYDWFWLMDDDVEPTSDGLCKLLKYSDWSLCIHGRRKQPDGQPFPWGDSFNPRTVMTTPIDRVFEGQQKSQQINVGCFEGMLISRTVVEKIGFPDKTFFMVWDDTYYGYLASKVTPVLYVNEFTLQRKRTIGYIGHNNRWAALSPTALYYFSRNRFLIARELNNFSLLFMWSSLKTLIRSICRELIIRRSVGGAVAIVSGFYSGVQYWVRCTPSGKIWL